MNTYDRLRAMVIRNLKLTSEGGLGTELVIKRTVTTKVPGSGTVTKVTTEYKTTALRNQYRNFDINGTTIKETDVNLYVSPICTTELPDPDWVPDVDLGETEADRPLIDTVVDTPELTTQDVLEMLGKKYTTINVRPWNHAGVSIGFKVQGRVAA